MTLVVAHRGLGFGEREHSLEGYTQALEAGADGVEVDVHLSRDGQLFCVHDSDLKRTHGLSVRVSALGYQELVALGLVPLWQVLELIKDFTPSKGIVIETKHPVSSGGLVERRLVTDLNFYGLSKNQLDATALMPGHAQLRPWVVPMSFSLIAIRRLHELLPQLPAAYLLNSLYLRSVSMSFLPANSYLGPRIELLSEDGRFMKSTATLQRQVFVWTVNQPQQLAQCFQDRVTCVITDVAALALQIRELSSNV